MNNQNKPSVKSPEIFYLSMAGVGFAPKAPGTFGTIATLPLLYVLGIFKVPAVLLIPFFIIILISSCFIADYAQKKWNVKDPSWIVIDEFIGMMCSWFFLPQTNALNLFILFVLFRFFDIVKIWPASYFDQKVSHGAGTVLDDVVSGIFAGGIFAIGHYFLLKA